MTRALRPKKCAINAEKKSTPQKRPVHTQKKKMHCRRATLIALVALLVSLCALGVLYRSCAAPRAPSSHVDSAAPRAEPIAAPIAAPRAEPRSETCDAERFAEPRAERIAAPCAPRAVFTHGLPRYAQVGVLESAGKEPVALFGRPTRRGSDRWNYFAVTTSYSAQKLPVYVRGVDAARLAGCAELSDGESVDVRGYGAAKVALYTRDDAEHQFALRAD